MDNASNHRPVETVERAFDVLDFLQDRDGAGVTDVANELGLAKSTAHRHLQTLESRGFLVRDRDTYRVSTWFLDYGIYARDQYSFYEVAKPKVDELAAETDEKVWCVVEEHGMGVHIYGQTGKHSVKTHARVGNRSFLHQFAAGKAILANLPADRTRSILDEYGLPGRTEATITDRDELIDELETVRDRGYAYNYGESVVGVHAVGAPVRDESGDTVGAISIAGPANRLEGDLLAERLPELLLGATNEIEINLAHA